MLKWSQCDFNKKRTGTHYVEIVFLNLVESAGHVLHSSASGTRSVDALFFMLGCAWYGFQKKCTQTHYAELVFFHRVGSACHIVHSGASGMQNVDAPFFMH
jgi:hypothetical protein